MSQITHFILPSTCLFCGYWHTSSQPICLACVKDLPILSYSCSQCAESISTFHHDNHLCGTCLRSPPPFDKTYALFPYRPPIIQLITRLKFQQQLSFATALATLFLSNLQEWYKDKSLPDLIMPIPLHHKRLQQRGFNQAHEIAKPIAKALALPLDCTGIKRIKNTSAQSQLSSAKRQENIANAFVAERSYTGMAIAVMDDVVTTGYTIREFCRVLRLNGAKSIDVWCCARNQKSNELEV